MKQKTDFDWSMCFRHACIKGWSNEKCPQYELCWGKNKEKELLRKNERD
mgnify:CR=1 FL=1